MLGTAIPNKLFHAKVVKSEIVAQGVKKISFKINQPFPFEAWQYVWVEIPELKVADPRGSRRAFSILNTINADNIIEIVARISQSGYKQSLFALVEGDSLIIHGPFGDSFALEDGHLPENVMMIAGGVGIAAFLPMIKTVRDHKWPIKMYLVYLNNTPEATPFLQELEELKKGGDFFDYQVKYTNFVWADIQPVSQGLSGKTEWWIAGPQAMVNLAFAELSKSGIARIDMVFGNFYPTTPNNLTSEMINRQLQEDSIFAKGILNSTNHWVITDAEGIVLFANAAAEKTTGYTQAEILGNTPRLWGGMMSGQFYRDLWQKKQSGQPFKGEIINRRKNGQIYHTIAHISPILDHDNSVIGYIATEEDITPLISAKDQLAASEGFLSSIIENLPAMVFVKDAKDLKFVKFNKAGEALVGVPKAEMIGKSDTDFFPPDQAAAFIAKDREVLNSKTMTDIPEEPIETQHQGRRLLHTKKIPILDAQGQPEYLLGISEDITESKAILQKLNDQNAELQKMNQLMVDRELKMIELKAEIAELKKAGHS